MMFQLESAGPGAGWVWGLAETTLQFWVANGEVNVWDDGEVPTAPRGPEVAEV